MQRSILLKINPQALDQKIIIHFFTKLMYSVISAWHQKKATAHCTVHMLIQLDRISTSLKQIIYKNKNESDSLIFEYFITKSMENLTEI